MELIIAIVSILTITGLIWLANRVLPFQICPICAGVSGTWLWMYAGMIINPSLISNFQLPISILMGGTVVGIAYQIEKRLPTGRSPLLWKTLFIPVGFAAAYSLVNFWWMPFSAAAVVAAGLAWIFLKPNRRAAKDSSIIEKLKSKLKDCC